MTVFPTPVGMGRSESFNKWEEAGFPHARGDGPFRERNNHGVVRFSPRPWGWAAVPDQHLTDQRVFPTPVGMGRITAIPEISECCFPHARGDGPHVQINAAANSWFSPRPWGWAAKDHSLRTYHIVFPTPVGMVRFAPSQVPRISSFSHARGDGPRSQDLLDSALEFSPRPWGWSVKRGIRRGSRFVFPTPVGMVPRAGCVYVINVSFPQIRT